MCLLGLSPFEIYLMLLVYPQLLMCNLPTLGLAIYFFYGLRHSFVGLQLKMKSHVKLKQRPCVLAKNLCQFEYDMDVIPAHRDLAEGKTSPISPIFWSSLQKYHFFATDNNERDDMNGFY